MMRVLLCALTLAGGLSLTGQETAPPPAPMTATPSSASLSGQFIVYGSELRVRGGLAARCEEINEEFSRLLRSGEPWKLNIVIQVRPPGPADPPDMGITSQVSALEQGGFHLQVNVPERAGLRPADFRRAVIRVLLAERILRGHPRLASERDPLLPIWVETGVLKALDFKSRARPSAEFAAIFKSGRIYGIEQILDTVPAGLDGLSRTIYETSCCALLLALLDQPEGSPRFARFLSALAADGKPERELLRQAFPGLAESDSSLNKWWSLQLAQLASPGLEETLDPVASAELLDRALTFQVPPAEKPLPKPRPVLAIASQRPQAPPEPVPGPKPAAVATAAKPSGSTQSAPDSSNSKKAASARPGARTVSNRPREIPAAPQTTPAASSPAPAAEESEADRPGFLRHVFPFNLMAGDEAKADEPPAAEPAVAAQAAASTPPPAAASKTEDAKPVSARPAPAPAAAPPASRKAKPEPKPIFTRQAPAPAAPAAATGKTEPGNKTEEPAPAKRGFNPLNWFRGGDKDKAEPAPETPAAGANKTGAVSPQQRTGSLLVRDLLGNTRGRYIQSPLLRERADLLELPGIGNPPASQPVPTGPAIAYPIEDYAVILAHPERDRLLDQARLALKDLIVRGNVLFRELGKSYLQVIDDLAAGKTKGMDEKLAALRRQAVATLAQACAVQDHLDWYQATRSERASGLFDDYLDLPARIEEESPPRADPVSKHLDEVEARQGR